MIPICYSIWLKNSAHFFSKFFVASCFLFNVPPSNSDNIAMCLKSFSYVHFFVKLLELNMMTKICSTNYFVLCKAFPQKFQRWALNFNSSSWSFEITLSHSYFTRNVSPVWYYACCCNVLKQINIAFRSTLVFL